MRRRAEPDLSSGTSSCGTPGSLTCCFGMRYRWFQACASMRSQSLIAIRHGPVHGATFKARIFTRMADAQRNVRREGEARCGVSLKLNKRKPWLRFFTMVNDELCKAPASFITRLSVISSARPVQIAIGVAEVNTAILSGPPAELILGRQSATRW